MGVVVFFGINLVLFGIEVISRRKVQRTVAKKGEPLY